MQQAGFEYSRGLWREVRPRIGQREQVGLSAQWMAPRTDDGPKKWGRRREPEVVLQPAVVHDLSVSGARLLVPVDEAVAIHRVLQLEIGGVWASVRIAWVEPSPHESALWCGVMFVQPSPEFTAAVFAAMDAVSGGATLPTRPPVD